MTFHKHALDSEPPLIIKLIASMFMCSCSFSELSSSKNYESAGMCVRIMKKTSKLLD